ncbi:MAG: DUF433 domain-containing protein [Anaerolineaceae bacterium]|nr:DUF433 domain-containing protein [Anaerolineaceae bacterium]
MSRYALNLPANLKSEAEELASKQGISLNQFIMWSVSEKVTSLRQTLDDPNFPGITYRRGASGWIAPVIRGTGIRVQTIVKNLSMGMSPEQIAAEYELDANRIREAQAFYNAHRPEIEGSIRTEEDVEENRG